MDNIDCIVVSILAAMILGGLAYMFKTKCKVQCCCKCKKSKEVEKEEENQIYGEYYYTDGRRRATEMEVRF